MASQRLSQQYPMVRSREQHQAPGMFHRTQPAAATSSPGPPAMYDTSVSSATMNDDSHTTNSRSYYANTTGSAATANRNNRSPSQQQRGDTSWISSASPRFFAQHSSFSTSGGGGSGGGEDSGIRMQHPLDEQQHRAIEPSYSQSEPGAAEHDRFSAYINRFAELDPRMDHRQRQQAQDEQQQQQSQFSSTSNSSLTAKAMLAAKHRTASPKRQQQPLPVSSSSSSSELHLKTSNPPNSMLETRSDIGFSTSNLSGSSSGRTRDLARRFEERMGRQRLKAQQQAAAQSMQQHARPQRKIQERAAYLEQHHQHPEEEEQQQVVFDEPPQTSPRRSIQEERPQPQQHPRTEQNSRREASPLRQERQQVQHQHSPSEQQQQQPPPQQQRAVVAAANTRTFYSQAPDDEQQHAVYEPKQPLQTTTQRARTPGRRAAAAAVEEIPEFREVVREGRTATTRSRRPLPERTNWRSQRQGEQQAVPDHAWRTSTSTGRGVRDDAAEEEGDQMQQKRQRPKSMPPARRTRRLPLAAPAVAELAQEVDLNTSVITQLAGSGELETTSPARVRELQGKLWNQEELLKPLPKPLPQQRSSRSLSPKQYRMQELASHGQSVRPQQEASPPQQQQGQSARQEKSQPFKSRYYDAARREHPLDARSTDRSSQKSGGSSINNNKTTAAAAVTDRSDGKSSDPSPQRSRESSKQKTASATTTVTERSTRSEAEDEERDRLGNSQKLLAMATEKAARDRDEHAAKLQEKEEKVTVTAKQEETVESLLRKLGEINRDDPQAVLAQLDAILKQKRDTEAHQAETRDSTAPRVSSPSAYQYTMNEQESDGDDCSRSSTETSVSSITNPTYQDFRRNSEVVVGKAASGRPRPSVLQGYTNSATKINTPYQPLTGRGATWKQKTKMSPPASIVRVTKQSKEPERTVGDLMAEAEKEEAKQQHAKEEAKKNSAAAAAAALAAATKKEASVSTTTDKGGPSFLEKMGSYLTQSGIVKEEMTTHSAEIEEKIKRWDEMSTGDIPSHAPSESSSPTPATKEMYSAKTEELGSLLSENCRDLSPGEALKRAHPWDAAIPVRMGNITVRDTSMECGDGLEAQYTPRYEDARPSPDRVSVQKVALPDAARRMRKERLSRGMQNIKEEASVPHKEEETAVSGGGDAALTDNFETSKFEYQENTNAMTDAFDSAWVNLPSSSYFSPSKKSATIPTSQDRSWNPQFEQALARNPPSRSESGEGVEVEVEILPPSRSRPDIQTFSPEETEPAEKSTPYGALGLTTRHARHRSGTFDESIVRNRTESMDESFETSRISNSVKARRGLRGFLKRKQGSIRKTPGGEHATHVSTGSRRFADRKSLNSFMDRQAVNNGKSMEEPTISKTRKSARSRSPADRSRARSLDERRIRNPNIARKFNRLLRVYNDDVKDPGAR